MKWGWVGPLQENVAQSRVVPGLDDELMVVVLQELRLDSTSVKKHVLLPELDKVERDWKFAPAERGNETPSAATTAGLALPASWALKTAGSFDLPTEVLVPDYGGVSIAEVVLFYSPRVPTVIGACEKFFFLFRPLRNWGSVAGFCIGSNGVRGPLVEVTLTWWFGLMVWAVVERKNCETTSYPPNHYSKPPTTKPSFPNPKHWTTNQSLSLC